MDPQAAPPTPDGEATSFWQLKPFWCQPWSILLTGVAVPSASWLLLQRWWITAPITLAVLLWWWLFLVLVPASHDAGMSPQDGAQNRNL